MLQYVAVCFCVLQCWFLEYARLLWTLVHRCVAACCCVLQHVAVYFSVSQRVAVCDSVLQCVALLILGYGVATISRMLKNICLFAEYRSLL